MRTVLRLLLIVALLGCQSAKSTDGPAVTPRTEALIADRLFFGRNIPSGGTVSEADWEEFLRTVVTPRFPEGLTIWRANGQWRNPRGELVKEAVFVVEVFHKKSDEVEISIATIAAEYKKRFGQGAVLRVTSESEVRFY